MGGPTSAPRGDVAGPDSPILTVGQEQARPSGEKRATRIVLSSMFLRRSRSAAETSSNRVVSASGGSSIRRPVWTSHRLVVWRKSRTSRSRPSGENSSLAIPYPPLRRDPGSVRRAGPSTASQIRTLPSSPPVATSRPSGENAKQTHVPWVLRARRAAGRSPCPRAGRVPRRRAGQDGPAVGAEPGVVNDAGMLEDRRGGDAPVPPRPPGWPAASERSRPARAVPPQGLGHPEQPIVDVALPGELQRLIEVPGGDLGLGLDPQRRLGLGQAVSARSMRLAVGPPPLDGHAGEPREEDHHQAPPAARPPPCSAATTAAPAPRRPTRRARIGRSSRNRRRSSASASAVAYRWCRVARHRLEDDRLQVARDPRVELPRTGRVLVQDLVHQHGPIGVRERRPAADQLVERDAQPVDIGPRVALGR